RAAAQSPGAPAPPQPSSVAPHARVVIERGEVWWADLDEPTGSEPGYRRPVLIVQADAFNRSRLQTTIAVVLTSTLRLIDAPGNVLVPKQTSGLPKDSVANVSQLVTLDRAFLTERAGKLPPRLLAAIDAGLKLVLALP
ncbi:MAG TPA: type II toxin-antitoxin system PemK/MazF family toxin, partial [Gemmatimonadales bacterium]|nr:type II toxin-antitoxin system PemK/MazF family toxin [Gemmatimonadales bacterium]